MKIIKTLGTLTLLFGSAIASSSAVAGFSWTYTGNGTECPTGGCVEVDSDAGKTITSTATGWYSETTSGAAIQQARKLREWDGLGVEATSGDTSSPEHATDNNTWYDSVLFDFGGDSVELDQITMGWHTDSDFSLLRYTGNDTPTLAGNSYSDLTLTKGWELISNYFCSCGGGSTGADMTFNVNAENKSSSYWLVAAINPSYYSDTRYIGNDHFKIKRLAGLYDAPPDTPPGTVPTPATWLLMLAGAAALTASRRKGQKETATALAA